MPTDNEIYKALTLTCEGPRQPSLNAFTTFTSAWLGRRYVRDHRYEIEKVIFNDPATIIIWFDGSKTVVKCGEGDVYDPEKGMAMAIAKRFLGDKGNYYEVFKEWLPEDYEENAEIVSELVNDGNINLTVTKRKKKEIPHATGDVPFSELAKKSYVIDVNTFKAAPIQSRKFLNEWCKRHGIRTIADLKEYLTINDYSINSVRANFYKGIGGNRYENLRKVAFDE